MTDDRRDDTVPAMRLRPALLVALLVVLVELAVSAWAWGTIPAGTPVPVHWGIDGRADGFAPKEQALLGLPLLTLLLALLLVVMPRFEPRRANLARSGTAYRIVVVGIIVLLGAMHAVAIAAAADPTVDVGRWVVIGIGLLFALIGNWLGKVRSNFMFGIRTPWTLASDLSWNRTHRLAGRLWVGLGGLLVILAAAGVASNILAVVLFGGLLISLLWTFTYSYMVWAKDPGRTPWPR